MKKVKSIAIILLVLFVAAARGQNDTAAQIAELQRQVSELERKNELQMSIISDLLTSRHASAIIDTSSPNSFFTVYSSIGPVLIVFKEVQPYLTGYRVFLEIGNPHAARISDYSYQAAWSDRRIGDPGTGGDWLMKRKQRRFHGSSGIEPGMWKSVSIVLPDTTATELKYLEISFEVNQVDMPKQPKQIQ